MADESLLLRFENVATGYGSNRVLEKLSFSVETNDYLALVGSNGSGKTTLLRTILGLLAPIDGKIERPQGNIHFGYVPQAVSVDEIFPLTALEIVKMGLFGRLGALKRPNKTHTEKAQAALDEVGIGHLSGRLFRELSGGQKQRSLIARAIVAGPDILILDEHTNNLDIAGEKAIMELIDQVHATHKVAIVMVTHSLNAVANHAKHIGIIRHGRFDFAPVDKVMQDAYLTEFYGVPMQVIEVGTRKVVL
jgi:ABC-type Mn2+/Zn2+ transport system ATPase subunit